MTLHDKVSSYLPFTKSWDGIDFLLSYFVIVLGIFIYLDITQHPRSEPLFDYINWFMDGFVTFCIVWCISIKRGWIGDKYE